LITVLLAGTILSYLSFNNISNFEELTEKRILEEERTIHNLYSREFNNTVQILVDSLYKQKVNRDEELNQSFSPLVKDYLIMTKNGALIRPHFSYMGSSVDFSKNRTDFAEAFAQAEPQEFISERYEAAEAAYKKVLSLAKSSNDTSKVYNALIRLSVKQEQWNDAFNLYEELIRNYGMAENEFGFPYVYLSFDVLVNSGNVDFGSRRQELIALFLTYLMENKIAFTGNTGELLQNIASNTNIILKDTLKVLLNHAFERQQTLEDYRPLISKFLVESDNSDYIQIGSAKVINSENHEDKMLMLIEHDDYNFGYVIILEELDNVVLKNMDFNGFRFEYDLRLSRATLNPIDIADNTNINRRF
jgi:pentatricopeptide repeat protein